MDMEWETTVLAIELVIPESVGSVPVCDTDKLCRNAVSFTKGYAHCPLWPSGPISPRRALSRPELAASNALRACACFSSAPMHDARAVDDARAPADCDPPSVLQLDHYREPARALARRYRVFNAGASHRHRRSCSNAP
jgi:hypothetical protein